MHDVLHRGKPLSLPERLRHRRILLSIGAPLPDLLRAALSSVTATRLLGLALPPNQAAQVGGVLPNFLRDLGVEHGGRGGGDVERGVDVDGRLVQVDEALLHVGQDLLDVGDLAARSLVVVRVVQRGELDLLVLQLEARAVDGGLELGGRLVAQGLVDVVFAAAGARALRVGVVVGGFGDRGELEGQGELEVGLGDDFGFEGVELLLELERGTRVGDGVMIPGSAGEEGREGVCQFASSRRDLCFWVVVVWSFTALRHTSRSRARSRRAGRACRRGAP